MKHTFAKKALLLGAVLVGLSAGPLQAISNPFAGWTQEGMQRQLKSSMNRLDKEMKDVYRCIKSGGTNCASHRTEVISLIGTILALVGALKVAQFGQEVVGEKLMKKQYYKTATGIAPIGTPGRWMTEKARKAAKAAKAVEIVPVPEKF